MTAVPVSPDRFQTRDCRTHGCPDEAEAGYDYCAFCLRQPAVATRVIPDPPDGLRDAILDLIPLLGRYEAEAERRAGDGLLVARHDLRVGIRRAAKLAALT